jgi:copper(I)-binding protein
MRRAVIHTGNQTVRHIVTGSLAAIALTLSACGDKAAKEPSTVSSAPADATPENAPGITLSDAVIQLPAVSGRPGVAYFSVSQGNGAPRKLVAVHVDGAGSAQMHESMTANGVATMDELKEILLVAGKALEFQPGGYHVMLFDLDPSFKIGGTTELTITLDNGDKASVPATIKGPGGMDHDMSKM